MNFTISIAEKNISIHTFYGTTKELCRDYLAETKGSDFSVSITPEDLEREQEFYRKANSTFHADLSSEAVLSPGTPAPDALFPSTTPKIVMPADALLEPQAVYRKIATEMLSYDTFLMHGTVVAINGISFMYTAKSGTGKTTRAMKFLETYPEAYILNGDKPLLKLKADIADTRQVNCLSSAVTSSAVTSSAVTSSAVTSSAVGGEVFAYGTPWCGKEHMQTNQALPLKAIFLLERSEKNFLEKLTLSQAFPMLYQQTFRPNDPLRLIMTIELIKKMNRSVRFYRLACNREKEAAEIVYRALFSE